MYSIYRLNDGHQEMIATGLTIREASELADKILRAEKETALLIEKYSDDAKDNNE